MSKVPAARATVKSERAKSVRKPARKRVATQGYARGRETRQRIVDTAIHAFGEAGFEQASTRMIADEAGVNLGALTYYFGNKEGLYRACAEHIADRVEEYAKPTWDRLEAALEDKSLSRSDLLGLLRGMFDAASEDVVDRKSPRSWILFITRETAEPGMASRILHERLMVRALRVLSTLLARITGRSAEAPETIVRTVTMIGNFMMFRSMRRLLLRAQGWTDFADGRNDLVKSVIWQQIEAGLTLK